MKLLGSIYELVKVVFRDSLGNAVEVEPADQTVTTGTATVTIPDLGAGGSDTIVMEAAENQTLSNKTVDASNEIDAAAIADHSVTNAEFQHLAGVTSAIQTQLDDKEPTITTLPISQGGTGSSTALTDNKAIISSGGAIVESTVTSTELGYLAGVSSSIQNQLDASVTEDATLFKTDGSRFLEGDAHIKGDHSIGVPRLIGAGTITAGDVQINITGSIPDWVEVGMKLTTSPAWSSPATPVTITQVNRTSNYINVNLIANSSYSGDFYVVASVTEIVAEEYTVFNRDFNYFGKGGTLRWGQLPYTGYNATKLQSNLGDDVALATSNNPTGPTDSVRIETGVAGSGASGSVYIYTGSSPTTRGLVSIAAREVNLNNVQIKSLAAGTSSADAVNKGQLDGVATDLSDHESASSGTHGVTGNIVGTIDSQTLTNKQVSSTADMTGALLLPSGTEAERPTPSTGMVRHNSDTDSFEGYAAGTWASIGGGGTVDRIAQVGHGFVVGEILYLNGSTYTKAIATAANTAEVVGMVSRVIDTDTFEMTLSGEVSGLSGLTAGEAYFLSDTVAGAISATEPSVVGYISVPVGVASSTTSFYVAPKRGVVVGAANALTQIPLSNNTTNTVQDVSAYNAGELSGWVEIDATTPYKFYVNAQFSENGAGTDFNVSYQTSGDTPPAGFSITITSAGILQAVMPNLAGFVSASINYGLNVAAVGASLPLSISARNVVGDTSGTAVPTSYIGEKVEGTGISVGSMTSGTYYTVATITLNKGVYLVLGQCYANPTTGINISTVAEVMSTAGTPSTTRMGSMRSYASAGGYVQAQGTNTFVISADSTTLYLRQAVFHAGTVNGGVASQQKIEAYRIA